MPLTQTTPDIAIDLLNVIVGSNGELSKLRLPINLSPAIGGFNAGPYSFWDFQQAVGTRQVLAHFGSSLYYFTNDLATATLIETNNLNLGAWSFVEANNILFGANGSRMQKWTGAAWQKWGITAPTSRPSLGVANLPTVNVRVIEQLGTTDAFVILASGSPVPSVGQSVTFAGNSFAGYNATWAVTSANPNYAGSPVFDFNYTIAQGSQTNPFVGNGGTVAYNLSLLTGWSYAYAYKNSITGHVSNISPTTFAGMPASGKMNQMSATAPTDPQVDTIVWFRTTDGGGDYFRLAEVNLTTGALVFNAGVVNVVAGSGNLSITDNTTDGGLDLTTRGPLINNPPPQGQYVAVAQGRVFIVGLAGALNDIVYSGYEQIITGRPEESFPPNNRLHVQIGAESVVGLGALHGGVVMFSNTGRFWQLRGAIEDITLSAPVAFSDVFEELPWTLGCLSHYTIQNTPYGLVWLAGDKTVQFWDGRSEPIDISKPVYPLLRTITPGTELQCVGAYFNWLERDWYALTCATNGAGAPNTIIFWALDSQSSEIDVFVSSLQANWLGVVSTSKLQRKLLLSNVGRISELPVRATDQSGLTNDFTTYPPTSGNLPAYWRGGYFGNDSPEQSKLFRWARFVPDRGLRSYQVQARFVDDTNTIDQPRILGPTSVQPSGRVALNQRGYRSSVEIDFPETDVSCNVLELQMAWIGTSQR